MYGKGKSFYSGVGSRRRKKIANPLTDKGEGGIILSGRKWRKVGGLAHEGQKCFMESTSMLLIKKEG